MKLKVMTIFGTRPEAIKMAPLVKELQRADEFIETQVAVTAQHREMLDQVLQLFEIKPDFDLNIMKQGQTLFSVTNEALTGLQKVLTEAKPDLILVHGDTSTTFVGSLAAFYLQIPIGHVEAGLRTSNKYSPYPEEMNRRLTGCLADIHFAPTANAAANLKAEGVPEESVFITGNTVIDALQATVQDHYEFTDVNLQQLDFQQKKIILLTTHRRENLGAPMKQVYEALKRIVLEEPSVEIVFPVHKNPKVRQVVAEVLGNLPQVHLIEPLEYRPFVNLMGRSHLVLTDSGGLQEEAPSLGKPVLVLRDTTERPEAVTAGTVKLVGTNLEEVYQHTKKLLTDQEAYQQMATAVNPYGDGKASQRIVDYILHYFGKIEDKPLFYKNK